ncbi:MAG: acyl-[acyl-carrier-protein] thioesterase [Lachnospiraceae bacterium]|nr:acyl-[acyl-carrier-protein] thioesterase [Lachnospiraceae bacterium]
MKEGVSVYTFDGRVRYSEVGVDSNMTIESLLDYFQDASIFHSEEVGLGADYFKEQHLAWLLSAWQICVNRRPRLCEHIVIGTAPYDFKGFVGLRNFWMKTKEGEVLAYANSIWSLMDVEKQRPAKVEADYGVIYHLEEKYPMEYAPRKIPIPADGVAMEPFAVRNHHLDTNHHVNNGQYVRMAMDYIPEQFEIGQLRVEYKNQAVLDDMVYPVAAVNEDRTLYTVSLNREDGRPYSIVEMKKAGA